MFDIIMINISKQILVEQKSNVNMTRHTINWCKKIKKNNNKTFTRDASLVVHTPIYRLGWSLDELLKFKFLLNI